MFRTIKYVLLKLACRMSDTVHVSIIMPKDNFVHAQLVCDGAAWSVSTAYSQMCKTVIYFSQMNRSL